MKVSEQQIAFFDKLLEEKDFGSANKQDLKETFATLNMKSGSTWIEKAMKLPKVDTSQETVTEPAF